MDRNTCAEFDAISTVHRESWLPSVILWQAAL